MKLCPTSIEVLALVAVIGVAMAQAQESVPGWPQLDTTGLNTVYLTDDTGSETTGRLISLDEDSIALLVDGTTERFPRDRVRRLEKRGDSLLNGAIIGGLIGGALTTIGAAFSDCPDGRSPCTGTRIAYGIGGAALYGAIGAGIDALITGRTTMYEAAEGTPSAFLPLTVEPGVAPGPQLSFRFRW